MSRQPKYTYSPKGSLWVVYQMEYKGVFTSGTPIARLQTREEARKECYRLNGWMEKKPEKK